MTLDELTKMCRRLAGKYKSGQMKDDLVQEGLLACLELLNDDPECHPAKMHRAADRAMWKYLNFSNVPVSVPKHDTSVTLKSGSSTTITQNYSEKGLEELSIAVNSTSTNLKEEDMLVDGAEVAYEDREYQAYVATKVVTVLDEEERQIIRMRYYYNMSLETVGNQLGMSKQAVSLKEKAALKKLEKHL